MSEGTTHQEPQEPQRKVKYVLCLRLPNGLAKRLRRAAFEFERTQSDVAAAAIREYLDRTGLDGGTDTHPRAA